MHSPPPPKKKGAAGCEWRTFSHFTDSAGFTYQIHEESTHHKAPFHTGVNIGRQYYPGPLFNQIITTHVADTFELWLQMAQEYPDLAEQQQRLMRLVCKWGKKGSPEDIGAMTRIIDTDILVITT